MSKRYLGGGISFEQKDVYQEFSGEESGGDITVESKSIDANGTYTAPSGKAYSPVIVDVPNTYAAEDEGKVVSNGELVAQTAHAEVTQNGTIDTTLNNSVTVNVSSDITLANVTVTFESGFAPVDISSLAVYQDELVSEMYFHTAGTVDIGFIMWKGSGGATLLDASFELYDKTKVSVSGDVSIVTVEDEWWLDITGDGTITISA